MKNPSNIQQIQTLAQRMTGYRKSWIVDAFQSEFDYNFYKYLVINQLFLGATRLPYSYLLMDNKQTTPDHLRIKTNIFPSENSLKKPQVCFVQKSSKNLTLF